MSQRRLALPGAPSRRGQTGTAAPWAPLLTPSRARHRRVAELLGVAAGPGAGRGSTALHGRTDGSGAAEMGWWAVQGGCRMGGEAGAVVPTKGPGDASGEGASCILPFRNWSVPSSASAFSLSQLVPKLWALAERPTET